MLIDVRHLRLGKEVNSVRFFQSLLGILAGAIVGGGLGLLWNYIFPRIEQRRGGTPDQVKKRVRRDTFWSGVFVFLITAILTIISISEDKQKQAALFGSIAASLILGKAGVFIFTAAILPALKAIPAALSGYYVKKWLDERGKKKTTPDTPLAELDTKAASNTPEVAPPVLPAPKTTRARTKAKPPELTIPTTPEPITIKRAKRGANSPVSKTPQE